MQEILDNWAKNRGLLKNLDEADLKTLLSTERKRKPFARETVLISIHQRQSRLRVDRERAKLIDFARNSKAKADAKAKNGAARK